MTIDAKDFRNALSKFPTGVTIITAYDESGESIGVTASSFNSVSLDPALVLWSIDKRAYSFDTFTKGQYFSIHVLKNEQADLSSRFARQGENKFSGIELHPESERTPRLNQVAAWFECERWNVCDAGDHAIIIGKVIDYSYEQDVDSLIFFNGSYAKPQAHALCK